MSPAARAIVRGEVRPSPETAADTKIATYPSIRIIRGMPSYIQLAVALCRDV